MSDIAARPNVSRTSQFFAGMVSPSDEHGDERKIAPSAARHAGARKRCGEHYGRAAALIIACFLAQSAAFAAPRPSLFRGVIVVDGRGGVRVVSVEERSQAFLADLRPEDLILRVNDMPTSTIDQFATISQLLRGRQARATLLIMRAGELRDLTLHLYSYPVLQHWNLEFVPDHDIRFGDPSVGRDYWIKEGRTFQAAGRLEDAMNAFLNALHSDPASVDTAWMASEAIWDVAQVQLSNHQLAEGIGTLQRELALLERLFETPIEEGRLRTLKIRLAEILTTLKQYHADATNKPLDN